MGRFYQYQLINLAKPIPTLLLLAPQSRSPPEILPLFSGKVPHFHSSISNDAAENLSAWIAACCRSGMNKYELIFHLRELEFREINQLFAKLLGLANSIHEGIYSQHPIYFPIPGYPQSSALVILSDTDLRFECHHNKMNHVTD